MTDVHHSLSTASRHRAGRFFCWVALVYGVAHGAYATVSLGPLDLTRTLYNQIVGDTPHLKHRLVKYIRDDIERRRGIFPVEYTLANELAYPLDEGTSVDPQRVGIEVLWDAAERHARTPSDRFVWTRLP